jgi:hypothetical protein
MLPNAEPQPLERSLLELEGRVRALETTVAGLGDTRQMEARVTERVSAQLPRVDVAAVVEALATQPLPPAVKTLVATATQPSTLKQVAQSSWLAFDMVQELVMIGRMLLDRRYHTAWITRFFVIVFAIAIFTSGLWVPLSSVTGIGPVVEKLVNLLLGGVMFLALACETRRYKAWRTGVNTQAGHAP